MATSNDTPSWRDKKSQADDTTTTDAAAATTTASTESATTASESAAAGESTNLSGRSVFSIETTAAGVVVRTAFLTEDNRILDMPAVFPDAMYAFNVIDDLKRQVAEHFGRAARVGAQVIANNAAEQRTQSQTDAANSTEVGASEAGAPEGTTIN